MYVFTAEESVRIVGQKRITRKKLLPGLTFDEFCSFVGGGQHKKV